MSSEQDLLNRIAELEEIIRQLARPPPPSPPPPRPPFPHAPPPLPAQPPSSSDGLLWWYIAVPIIGVAILVACGIVLWFYCRRKSDALQGRCRCCWGVHWRKGPQSTAEIALSSEQNLEDIAILDPQNRQRFIEQLVGTRMDSRLGVQDDEEDAGQPCTELEVDALVRAAGTADGALLAAAERGARTRELIALLQRGASPNASFLDRCVLSTAARNCAPAVTQALLAAGAIVDKKDGRGWTALMHAIDAHSPTHSREAVLALLLDAGAAVDVWGEDLKGPRELMEAKHPGGESELATIIQAKERRMPVSGHEGGARARSSSNGSSMHI